MHDALAKIAERLFDARTLAQARLLPKLAPVLVALRTGEPVLAGQMLEAAMQGEPQLPVARLLQDACVAWAAGVKIEADHQGNWVRVIRPDRDSTVEEEAAINGLLGLMMPPGWTVDDGCWRWTREEQDGKLVETITRRRPQQG